MLGLFFVWLIWIVLSFFFRIIFPLGPEEADQAFGKLPRPFQTVNTTNKLLELDLQTPGGEFPANPTFLPVFAIPALEGKFTSLENGSEIARNGGLDSNPIKLNEPVWLWNNSKNPNRSLKLNIVTNNFVYAYDWVADPESLLGVFKTTDSEIAGQARNFLGSFKSLKDEFKEGKTKVSFWKLEGSTRNRVGSFSEANAVLVEFFRKDISFKGKNYALVEPNTNLSSVNILISPAGKLEKRLLELNFTYWGVDFNNFGTYNLKTAEAAYADLKEGKSHVATDNARKFKTVVILKIYLAYLSPIKETRFLQPVYVFEGEGQNGPEKEKFVAYVSAISPEFQK